MKFNITLNQPRMIENNLNVSKWCILDIICVAPAWCITVLKDNEVYYWVARQKIAKELEALNLKSETIYRYIKQLAELGFIDYIKDGKKDLVRLTPKGKKLFSDTMSEKNTDTMSEKNTNHYVGNKSENNSEKNPTYNNTNTNNNTNNNNPFIEIISFLNKKLGTRYKPDSKETRKLIKARLNEGFTIEDFKTVISKKADEWLFNKDMISFLRPQTLFGSKFESYLNKVEAKEKTVWM